MKLLHLKELQMALDDTLVVKYGKYIRDGCTFRKFHIYVVKRN